MFNRSNRFGNFHSFISTVVSFFSTCVSNIIWYYHWSYFIDNSRYNFDHSYFVSKVRFNYRNRDLISNCSNRLHHYVYLFRKNYPQKAYTSFPDENNPRNFDSISIPIDQFSFYVLNMHQDNNIGFIRLFENISESSNASISPARASQMEYNQSKNRYTNILTCMT